MERVLKSLELSLIGNNHIKMCASCNNSIYNITTYLKNVLISEKVNDQIRTMTIT